MSIPDQPSPLPSISIVLPVRNEERFIAHTLERLAAQHYPRSHFELLVVDGCSTDRTTQLVRSFAGAHPEVTVVLIENPRRLSSAARNLGVRAARGDYVLIVDGHVDIPRNDLLLQAARLIGQTGALVLGRPQRLTAGVLSPVQRLIAAARGSKIGHAQDSHIYDLNEGWAPPSSIAVMYRRDLIREYGGFDESFDAAEDLEFNTRLEEAGLRCYTSPTLEVLYFPRDSFPSLLRQMRRYGVGRARLWRKHRTWPSALGAAPALMVLLGTGLTALGLFFTAWGFAGLAACALGYLGLVAGVRWRDPALKLHSLGAVLVAMLVIHGGLGLGICEGALRSWRSQP